MTSTQSDYVRVAKIIAECPAKRLPYVIDILRKGGVDIDESICELAGEEQKEKAISLRERRAYAPKEWIPTKSECALALRKAYEEGVSFTTLSRASGVNRGTLYSYMKATRNPPPFVVDQILSALANL